MGIDSTAIIVAALAFLGTVGGSWMGVRQSNKLVNWRIDNLEEKMDRHNHVVERMAVAEQSLKSVHKRVDAVEQKIEREH